MQCLEKGQRMKQNNAPQTYTPPASCHLIEIGYAEAQTDWHG